MKVVDIALKDLLRSLRSAFLLVMMFVAPLLITALLYLAFSGLLGSGGRLTLPKPAVLVVNLDQPRQPRAEFEKLVSGAPPGEAIRSQGSVGGQPRQPHAEFEKPVSGAPPGEPIRSQGSVGGQPPAGVTFRGGELLAQQLSGPGFAQLLDVRPAENEAMARQAVDRHQADVAVIIPPDFTAATEEPGHATRVLLYHHPDSSIGARVVKVMVSDFVDGFAGAKIAVHVASHQLEAQNLTLGAAGAEAVAQAYVAWLQSGVAAGNQPSTGSEESVRGGQPILNTRLPAAKTAANQATLFLGPVMSGLMVFFMFFTGAAAAMSILYEEQDGTLARLFSTPTPQSVVLGGKFLAVVVTLLLQAVVLMIASSLIFGIRWGQLPSVALLTCGVVVAASGFGILIMSFIRSTRQAGPVMAVVITLTGLLAGLMPTGDPSQPPPFEKFTLALPQGWAQHGWRLILAGGGPAEILVPFLVLVAVGGVCFAAGAQLFRRRFQ